MLEELIKLANHLDNMGLASEADALDKIVQEAAAGYYASDEITTGNLGESSPGAFESEVEFGEYSVHNLPEDDIFRIQNQLQEVYDKDGDKRLNLRELVKLLEDTLDSKLGDISEGQWLDADWSALARAMAEGNHLGAASIRPDDFGGREISASNYFWTKK